MRALLMSIRRWVYRTGRRPRPGTLLYSPTLEIEHEWRAQDAFWRAHWAGYDQGRKKQP